MSPRIRRICRPALSSPDLRGFNTLYISYLPLFGRFAANVSANPSYLSSGPLVSGPSGFQHPVYFVSSCLRPIRCGCLRESVVFLLSCPNPACPSSGLRASRRTVPIARSRLFLRLLSELPGLCLRALSGHSGSFFPALCGGTVSVSLRDGCAVFPSSVCSDAEYSAIPSSFLLSGSKPACPGFLRILS